VRAGKKNIVVELVNVDHIRILVGVELVGILVILVGLVVAVLQDESVGVAAEERVLEGLDLVEDWRLVADAQALGVDYLGGLGSLDDCLIFVHYYI
jgi:hypothetical protein